MRTGFLVVVLCATGCVKSQLSSKAPTQLTKTPVPEISQPSAEALATSTPVPVQLSESDLESLMTQLPRWVPLDERIELGMRDWFETCVYDHCLPHTMWLTQARNDYLHEKERYYEGALQTLLLRICSHGLSNIATESGRRLVLIDFCANSLPHLQEGLFLAAIAEIPSDRTVFITNVFEHVHCGYNPRSRECYQLRMRSLSGLFSSFGADEFAMRERMFSFLEEEAKEATTDEAAQEFRAALRAFGGPLFAAPKIAMPSAPQELRALRAAIDAKQASACDKIRAVASLAEAEGDANDPGHIKTCALLGEYRDALRECSESGAATRALMHCDAKSGDLDHFDALIEGTERLWLMEAAEDMKARKGPEEFLLEDAIRSDQGRTELLHEMYDLTHCATRFKRIKISSKVARARAIVDALCTLKEDGVHCTRARHLMRGGVGQCSDH